VTRARLGAVEERGGATPEGAAWRRRRYLRILAPALLIALALSATASEQEDAFPAGRRALAISAHEVLSRAFTNFYGCDIEEQLDFHVTTESGQVMRHVAERIRKQIRGRTYDLFSIRGGTDRREYRSLRIQGRGGSDDLFAYVPDLLRVRRLSSAQRGDQFFGSNLSLEDLEVQFVERNEIVGRATTLVEGEPAHIVTTQPLYDSGYDRADFFVAQSDYALLEIRFYRGAALEAYKVAHMPRADTESQNGHHLPRRMIFQDLESGTQTEIYYRSRLVNPPIDDGLFTKTTLESRRRLLRSEPAAPPRIYGE
jgi:hypothetical protein